MKFEIGSTEYDVTSMAIIAALVADPATAVAAACTAQAAGADVIVHADADSLAEVASAVTIPVGLITGETDAAAAFAVDRDRGEVTVPGANTPIGVIESDHAGEQVKALMEGARFVVTTDPTAARRTARTIAELVQRRG